MTRRVIEMSVAKRRSQYELFPVQSHFGWDLSFKKSGLGITYCLYYINTARKNGIALSELVPLSSILHSFFFRTLSSPPPSPSSSNISDLISIASEWNKKDSYFGQKLNWWTYRLPRLLSFDNSRLKYWPKCESLQFNLSVVRLGKMLTGSESKINEYYISKLK